MPTNDQKLKDYLAQFGYQKPKQYQELGSSGKNYQTPAGGIAEILAKIGRGQIIKHRTEKQEGINEEAQFKANERMGQDRQAMIQQLRGEGLERLAQAMELDPNSETPSTSEIIAEMKAMEDKRTKEQEREQENQPIVNANQFNANQPMPADMTPMLSKDFQNGFPGGGQGISPDYARAAVGGSVPEAAKMVRQSGGDMNLFDFLTTLQDPDKTAKQEMAIAAEEYRAGGSYDTALAKATKAYKLAHPISTTPSEREYIKDRNEINRLMTSEAHALTGFYRTYESQYATAKSKYEKDLAKYDSQSDFDKKYNPLPEPKFDLKKMGLVEYLESNPDYKKGYEYGYDALMAVESGKEPPENVKSAVKAMRKDVIDGKVTIDAALESAKQSPRLGQWLEWIEKELR